MGKEKITADMNMFEVAMVMSEGNPGALFVVKQMMGDPRSFMDVLLCDTLDIRGYKLYMLHSDCCGRNDDKFNRTLMMLRCGVFSEEQIQSNFELYGAIPFIDDSIVIEGVPPYGEDFGPTHEQWEELYSRQKEAFTKKLNAALDEQRGQNGGGPKV